MEESLISYYQTDLKMAEIEKELICEAISARLRSGTVSADQLADLADVLRVVEARAEYKKSNLEGALAQAAGEANGKPDGEGK